MLSAIVSCTWLIFVSGLCVYSFYSMFKNRDEWNKSNLKYQQSVFEMQKYFRERRIRDQLVNSLVAEREKAKARGDFALAYECDQQIATIALSLICRR